MTPVTVITGASAGIGAAMARVFASHGHQTVLIARRAERLNEIAAEIAALGRPNPTVLPLDLTEANVAIRVGDALSARGLEPQYIVNNAGYGLIGRAATLELADQLAMIDLNARALTDLSLAFVDSLARHRGGILNVGSVGSFLPGPGSAVYYANKAFVLSFSEALQQELKPRGIRVTCLCPGPVPTEFQARSGVTETPPPWSMSPQRVAEAGYAALMKGRRIVVPGFANKLVTAIAARWTPRAILLERLDRRQLKRRPEQR